MLTIHRDKGGVLQTAHAERLPDEVIWIDLMNPTDEEKAFVETRSGLRVPTIEALSEIESSSRLIADHDDVYLSMPLVARSDTDEYQISPVGFILTRSLLVTVRFADHAVFKAVADKVRTDPALRSATGVFTTLLEGIVDRGADVLERLAADLDRISRGVFGSNRRRNRGMARSGEALRSALTAIGTIGDRIAVARDILLGVDRIVPFVLGLKHDWIVPEFETRLNAVARDVTSLNAYEEHLSSKVQFLLDAVLGFINIAQNDLFKILTIASVVGIPPVLIAGIYGMNFKHMPELDWAWGYPYGLALIAISAIIPLAWFKWREWF
jgi:magnesium transporter